MSMEDNTVSASSLSSIETIQKQVDFNSGDYSTTKTLGSFINNREFMRGFVDYLNNKNSS